MTKTLFLLLIVCLSISLLHAQSEQHTGRILKNIRSAHQEKYSALHVKTITGSDCDVDPGFPVFICRYDTAGNLTDSIGLEFPKELAVRKAVITLQMAGFTEEKSREILPRLPGELSDGERHRVALAQVLLKEPRLVILDEATGTMDPITKQDVKHSILHARDEMDETFIVVSHDMDFVRDICDRVALMRGGKIIQTGKTAEILKQVTDDEKND